MVRYGPNSTLSRPLSSQCSKRDSTIPKRFTCAVLVAYYLWKLGLNMCKLFNIKHMQSIKSLNTESNACDACILIWSLLTNNHMLLTISIAWLAYNTKQQTSCPFSWSTSSPKLTPPTTQKTTWRKRGIAPRVEMSREMTKPTKCLCAQRRLRSTWASAQSDQCLRCPHEETLGS